MNYFRGAGMFGSAFLGAHLMRGAAAAALLAWAIVLQTAHPWLSLGAGVAALVALRGCPMCWTVGLVETLSQGRRDSTAGRADRTSLHARSGSNPTLGARQRTSHVGHEHRMLASRPSIRREIK